MTIVELFVRKVALLLAYAWGLVKKVLLWHPLGRPFFKKNAKNDLPGHLALAVVYRLFLLPLPLGVVWLGVLINLTHPTRHTLAMLPEQFSLTYDDVEFRTVDGVRLSGWYISSLKPADVLHSNNWRKPRPAVILCHGYGAGRDQFLSPLGTELVAAGYDVLLFDFRGHGRSDDAPVSFGVTEAADVVAAVDFLRKKPGVDKNRIGIFGSSMGAYAAMLAAGRCEGIKCVVADSAYPSVYSTLRRGAESLHVPPVVGSAMGWGLSLYFGHRLMDETAVEAADEMGDRGLLLVSGANDRRMPARDLKEVLGSCHNASTLIVANAAHGQTFSDPNTAKMLVRYFDGFLSPDRAASR